ncbi:4-hydroxythreonine-4-phosphate dehydrogenase PdxA [Candidatus Saganbacteria bacterium]|nr:4-hydroxythreonine-4-phosphate dehydrogenase PdxA [Candidatus Saganbacteria bacterium]
MNRPIIAITMGDPSGIGPEVTVKAATNPEITNVARIVVIGDRKVIQYAIKIAHLPGVTVNPIKKIEDAKFQRNQIDVLDLDNVDMNKLKLGEVSSMCGKASFQYIEEATKLALSKKIDGITTGPINKEAIHKAGYKFQGHTEIFAKKSKTKKYGMMFVSDKLWVILVTTHLPLKSVSRSINKANVLEKIIMANDALSKAKRKKGKIGVAGLNPHAGEAGIFGSEEIKIIKPAVDEAKKMGINVRGPISPDAIFNLASAGAFDIVVAMYHDQGLIPLKLLSFNKSVNVTVGLPFIRTSVDHGTGFDIVGRGDANPGSMIQAIKVAASFARANK